MANQTLGLLERLQNAPGAHSPASNAHDDCPFVPVLHAPGLAYGDDVPYTLHGRPQLCCGSLLIGDWFVRALNKPMEYVATTWELFLVSDLVTKGASTPSTIDSAPIPAPGSSSMASLVEQVDWCVCHPYQVWPSPQADLVAQAMRRAVESCKPLQLYRLPAYQRLRLCSMYGDLIPLSPPLFIQLAHEVLLANKAYAWLQVSPQPDQPSPDSLEIAQAAIGSVALE